MIHFVTGMLGKLEIDAIRRKPENLDAWLHPEGRSLEDLQKVLADRQAPYYEHEVMAA